MNGEEHNLLSRMDERLKALGERLETTEARILEKLDVGERRMNDYSRRLRSVENWRWFLAGGLVLLGVVVKVLL